MKLLVRSISCIAFGAATVHAQTCAFTLHGAPGQGFGTTVASLGDFTGDGKPELLVGAPNESTHGLQSGAIYAYASDGTLLCAVYGSAPSERLGEVIAGVGDVDGDGVPDFAAGSPGYKDGTFTFAGRVLVFSSVSGSKLLEIDGGAPDLALGASIAAVGDVNGDGRADFAASLPSASTSAQNCGRVRLISGFDGSTLWEINGTYAGERLGYAIAAAGDLNGDGISDVLAQTHGNTAQVFARSGLDGTLLETFNVNPGCCTSITSIAGGFDLNGDGVPDIVAGEAFMNRVWEFSGANAAVLQKLDATNCDAGAFGFVVATIGDRDGDGLGEVVVRNPLGKSTKVFANTTTQAIYSDRYPSVIAMVAVGDWNGDGRADFAIGDGHSVRVFVDDSTPLVGTSFALGDGSGAPCPCGNSGPVGAGCANSSGTGVLLEARGSSSASAADLYFHSANTPFNHLVVLFSGTASLGAGFGVPFGDGLQGVGGSLKRLISQTPCAADFDWGPLTNGFGASGQTLSFQLWYRDLNGPCGGGKNTSNAIQITFTP